MLRDQSADRWDGQPFTRVALDEVFHPASLKWYRDRFHAVNPGFDIEQPHHEFLYDWGYLVKENGAFLPTRASVALFGSLRGVRNLLPRPILDVQFLGYGSHDALPETRWIDRLVSEVNIIEAWQQLLAKYLFFMPKAFRDIDPSTLERRDAPAGFRVFREAAMNLLIHQDYGDHSRKAVIQFFTDGVRFWNPGDSFGDEKRLLEPGEKEVRNPAIAMAMRRIGMCEQAGTGLRMMQREWQALGHAEPIHANDRVHKAFETFLPEPRNLSGEIAPEVTPEVAPEVRRLLSALVGEMSRRELQDVLGLKDDDHVREAYLLPALAAGVVEMTQPDKPNSRLQRYRLTELGRLTKQALEQREP